MFHRARTLVQIAAVLLLFAIVLPAAHAQLRTSDVEGLRREIAERGYSFTVSENPATLIPLENLCGLKPPPGWEKSRPPAPTVVGAGPLPSKFDWREHNGVTPVRNQGTCGGCWAFGTIGVVESAILRDQGASLDLSEQWLVSCYRDSSHNGCSGGWWAFDPMIDPGATLEGDFPYVGWDAPCGGPYDHLWHVVSWAYVGSNSAVPSVDAIKQAIYDRGPVIVGMHAGSLFQAYESGVFDADESGDINHAVVLVGWDDNQGSDGVWFLRNSWGGGWGEAGYMRISRTVSQVGYGAAYVNGARRYTKVEGQISQNTTWSPAQGPYLVSGVTVTAGTTLTIEPGTIVKFNDGASLSVQGQIVAQGTTSSPIYFTSMKDDCVGGDTNGDGSATSPAAGSWHYIQVSGSGANGTFEHCIARYGGYQYCGYYCWFYGIFDCRDGGLVTIRNSAISHGSPYGISCDISPDSQMPSPTLQVADCVVSECVSSGININSGRSSITGCSVTGCTLANNGGAGIWASYCQSPAFVNNTFSGNRSHGLYFWIDCPSATIEGNRFQNNWGYAAYMMWSPLGNLVCRQNSASGNGGNGFFLEGCQASSDCRLYANAGLPYVVGGQLAVASGTTLTVGPGTVVKFAAVSWYGLAVNGTLMAQGTASSPIYFTSIKDDSVGGDTNADGSATSPAPGDWGSLQVSGSGSNGIFDHCIARYGGYQYCGYWCYFYGILDCRDGGALSIANSSISQSTVYGISCCVNPGSPQPPSPSVQVADTTVSSCQWNGIYIDNSPSPSLARCTVTSNNQTGIYVSNSLSPSISGCTASGNAGDGLSVTNCPSAALTNNTFCGNISSGISCSSSSPATSNNILAFNAAGISSSGGAPTLRNNCVYGNTSYNYSGVSAGVGDISADPLFVNRTAGDYHLTAVSPCIEVGWDDAPGLPLTDMDGDPRVMGSHVDIGADERMPEVTVPGFNPPGGAYNSPQNVVVTCATAGAVIRYTTDGNDPTENDAIVTGPVFVDTDMILKARAWKTGWTPSSVQSALYTIIPMSGMKALPTNASVTIPGAVVTALSTAPGRFYVEADDRSCGIVVTKSGYTAVVGARVTVQGKVGTFTSGEKGVQATSVTDAGAGTIVPLMLTNRDVGGGDWRYNSTSGAGQKGVKDGPSVYSQALNNICMLITTTGSVTYSATGYFYVDDGCRLADNSGHIGIKVQGSVPPPQPIPPDWTPVGHYVTVTGISSCFKVGSDLYRQILATQVVLAQ